jgi:error-prone DNA polymerase
MSRPAPAYAELQVSTNFSFLRGASHPQELVFTAAALGLAGIGVTDRNTLAGVVRAHGEAKVSKIPFRVGARLDFSDGRPSLLCYPADRAAYGRLCRLLTLGKMRAEKGGCEIGWRDLYDFAEGQVLMAVPPDRLDEAFADDLTRLAGDFPGQVYLAAARPYGARDLKRLHRLDAIAREARAPMVATNDVLYHDPGRRPLQDVVSCIREKRTIETAGLILEANAERHLKTAAEMARLFRPWPGALERTVEILDRTPFSLDDLSYHYPNEPVPPGRTAMQHLREISHLGARWRYPEGVPDKVLDLLAKELQLIEELDYPNYFLTVHDVVAWARDRGILCQGRGSAANSVVCFCLGVTAVDPTKHKVLFARFLSKERSEPPDIDVDFEHERREEVMQYVFERYGRHRAAICATVIHYRPRSAIREVGKALGLTEDVTARLADTVWGSWGDGLPDEHIAQTGLDPQNPEIVRAVELATELLSFPRHLSQHVGGFILTEDRLDETVPIGNAAMDDRTFIEWDKDDIDELKLMKVDVLALGMLSCLKRGFDLLDQEGVRNPLGCAIREVADVPPEDPVVYDMICKADTIGVFQIESRAQMSMLPRLRPRKFYDLVIEVAIVRPGPIQGDMVHPYLRRRDGVDPVHYPSPHPDHGPADELEEALGDTLGVPLFQEQAMRLAIEAAKFTPDEANGLRRSMATFRNLGDVGVYREKFVNGMAARGYDPEFAERCFRQIEGFGSYGFPESHAVSFAKLVYASAWVKCHRPDVFCAAILNSQPMGFYQPAQLVRDAREHGVEVRGPDVLASGWDCTLEEAAEPGPLKAVRIGLREIRGMVKTEGEALVAAREAGARTPEAFAAAGVSRRALQLLAEADGFRSLGLDRRAALWAVKGLEFRRAAEDAPLLGLMGARPEPAMALPDMRLSQHVAEDYRTHGLSLKAHPCGFFREALARRGAVPAAALKGLKDGKRVAVAGLVLIRQRPGTAKGVCFLTLEDESGPANVVIWADRFAAHRKTVMTSSFLLVRGRLQRAGDVIHLVAEDFQDLSPSLFRLRARRSAEPAAAFVRSRDFH